MRGTDEFPLQRPVTWSFDVFFDIDVWVNSREAGYLRHHHVHYDVTVMLSFHQPPQVMWCEDGLTWPMTVNRNRTPGKNSFCAVLMMCSGPVHCLWTCYDHRRSWSAWQMLFCITLRWRHNEGDGVSNHQPNDCLLKRLRKHESSASLAFVRGIHWWPGQSRGKCFHLMMSLWDILTRIVFCTSGMKY